LEVQTGEINFDQVVVKAGVMHVFGTQERGFCSVNLVRQNWTTAALDHGHDALNVVGEGVGEDAIPGKGTCNDPDKGIGMHKRSKGIGQGSILLPRRICIQGIASLRKSIEHFVLFLNVLEGLNGISKAGIGCQVPVDGSKGKGRRGPSQCREVGIALLVLDEDIVIGVVTPGNERMVIDWTNVLVGPSKSVFTAHHQFMSIIGIFHPFGT